MKIKGLLDEDFVNYKKASMFIIFPYCSFKCEKESGVHCCQNSDLANAQIMDIDVDEIIQRYISNPITQAIVCGGLEPMDSFEDVVTLISRLRHIDIKDEVILYTGYEKSEIADKIQILSTFGNIIVKFGRFIPNDAERFDEVLGVKLQSSNQYAERI